MAKLQLLDTLEVGGKYEIKNYEEYYSQLDELLKPLKNLVVDDINYKTTKDNIANMNNLIKTLNESRLYQERQFMQPFNYGKEQVDRLIKLIDGVINPLKSQVKVIEDEYKQRKREQIEDLFDTLNNGFIKLDTIFDTKWLNKTYTIDKIKEEIEDKIAQVNLDLDFLKRYSTSITNRYLLIAYYRECLDVSKTMNWFLDQNEKKLKVMEYFKDLDANEEHYLLNCSLKAPKQRLNELLNYCKENKIDIEIKD